jgi:acetyl-CoA acyltransferase 1
MLNSHAKPSEVLNTQQTGVKADDDIVIVGMSRTAMSRAKRGPLRDTAPEAMLAPVLKAVVDQAGIDPKKVGDICIGNVLQGGAGSVTARMGQFLADLPFEVPLSAVNRQCSSGLQAVVNIANSIRANEFDFGIGGGVESMSHGSMTGAVDPERLAPGVFDHELARTCLIPMGITAENVAEKYGITRATMDQMAVESHQKAANAQKHGWSQKEITVIKTMAKDKDGNEVEVIADRDDGVRPQTTVQGLSKLKAAFKKDGTTHAGNSSQMTDGAAAVLLTRRSVAKQMGLKIIGKLTSYAVAGCHPEVMGIGPAVAIPEALKKAGIGMDKIDVFEINEAFASQATYCVEKLGVPKEKLNPRGGAMALGHPLGMTGARMIVTLMSELERTGKNTGIISMCIGTGMGAAAIFERE